MLGKLLDEIPAEPFIYPVVFYAQIEIFVFPSVSIEIRLRLLRRALYVNLIDYILKVGIVLVYYAPYEKQLEVADRPLYPDKLPVRIFMFLYVLEHVHRVKVLLVQARQSQIVRKKTARATVKRKPLQYLVYAYVKTARIRQN